MFKCMLIKRKLYDYLEGDLREKQRCQVKQHLDVCSSCRARFNQAAELIKAAADKTIPSLSQRFWDDFRVGLDDKLNRRLVAPFKFKPVRAWNLKPVMALALILMFILGGGIYKHYSKSYFYADVDAQLIAEAVLLAELDPGSDLNIDDDGILNYLDQLSNPGAL
ncbi:MAG: zf-HC2 domain-containing protein [Candidatus Omnitrophota bacterium]